MEKLENDKLNEKYRNNQGGTNAVVGNLLQRLFRPNGLRLYSLCGNDTGGAGAGVKGKENSFNRKMISFLVYR